MKKVQKQCKNGTKQAKLMPEYAKYADIDTDTEKDIDTDTEKENDNENGKEKISDIGREKGIV